MAIAGCLGGDDDGEESDDSAESESTPESEPTPTPEETEEPDDGGTEDDGSEETPTATPTPTPAMFQIASIDPETVTATVGNSITVNAEITNDGEASGTKVVELGLDGEALNSQEVTLDGGESTSVQFTVDTSELEPGEYTHSIRTEDDELAGTLTLEEDTTLAVGEAVTQANEIIDPLNNDPDGSISSINGRLENVDPIDPIPSVEAETESEALEEADRLREEWNRVQDDIFTQVPKEINVQAQDEFGFDLIEDIDTIQTAEDAREAAEGDASISDAAVDALNNSADIADDIEAGLNNAANTLERVTDSE